MVVRRLIPLLILSLIGVLGILGVLNAAILGLITLALAGITGWLLYQEQPAKLSLKERETEALKLRASRERERAFYQLASTLSSTLDYQKVLETALNIGELATDDHNNSKVVSVALIFRGGERQLHILNSHGLTRADQQLVLAGKEGILGLALKQGQSEPVFGTMPQRDPELQYFASLQSCKSILALPLRAGYDHYGVLVFGGDQPDAFSPDYVELLKAIGTLATIALQNAVLYQNILDEKEKIVNVEEDARKKLARDLHDGPTQSVAAIAMRVNYVRRVIEPHHKQSFDELGKIEDLARRTTKEIRHMLFTLRPLVLETQGLVAALNQLAEKMRETHNLRVIIEAQAGAEAAIDSHAQGVSFYIIEEAVNNARKHAQAEHIWVRLKRQERYFIIEIEDDGVGFDSEAVMRNYEQRGSLGMVNMRERTELIEGTLHLSSKEGEGTKINVLVPVREGTLSHTPQPETPAAPPPPPTRPPSSPAIKRIAPEPEKPNIPFASKRSPSN